MKNVIIYSVLLLCLFATKVFAQNNFETRAHEIANRIDKITTDEKAALKKEVEDVNIQLEKTLITKEQADFKKSQLAQNRASNIEKRVAVEQLELNKLVQEMVDGKIKASDTSKTRKYSIVFKTKNSKNDTIQKGEKRTTSQFVLAAGFNNVVTNNSVANSDFRYYGSHFYEVGLTYNTRLIKTNNLLHVKYGLSFMWNNLRPANNQNFGVNGNQTTLQTNAIPQADSRFRNVYLVFPLHLEFDFSPTKLKNNQQVFQSHKSIRLGIGGYLGTNLSTRQHIDYDTNGYENETVSSGDFNTSNFIYGTSAYLGYRETSLYLKYDLNPLFTSNVIRQNNISLGIRFDFN